MIGLIDYGAGNMRSVELALRRVGAPFRRVSRGADWEDLERVVLPGVGAAASAMEELEGRGLAEPLRRTAVPVLGICLGMHLLAEESEEGGVTTRCLARIRGRARRFAGPLPLPQIGWNTVTFGRDPLFSGLESGEHFYFAHSYELSGPETDVIGHAGYGTRFAAAVRSGDIAGVQFHPEKSGPAGLRLLTNFCRETASGGRGC